MDGKINLTFGDPEPVQKAALTDYLGTFTEPFGRYYLPPVQLSGLAAMRGANAHHGSCVIFRRNMLANAYQSQEWFSVGQFRAAALDFLTFGNAYLQRIYNGFGRLVRLKHVAALNMRRCKDNTFCLLTSKGDIIDFKPGEIIHVKEYDPLQQIYGVPDWLGGLQAALLNQDATLFRRRYYLNGSHLGYILYTNDTTIDPATVKELEEKVRQGKGVGNFRSLYMHIPGGKEKGVQIIPVGDINQKDEFEKIKNISSNDVIVAHRVHPALVAIKPENTGGFGDIEKIEGTYKRTEVVAMTQPWLDLNADLPKNMQLKFTLN